MPHSHPPTNQHPQSFLRWAVLPNPTYNVWAGMMVDQWGGRESAAAAAAGARVLSYYELTGHSK
jgi:hypothetical protein